MSDSTARLSVQMLPQSHQWVHTYVIKKGITYMLNIWKENVEKTYGIEAAVLWKKNFIMAEGVNYIHDGYTYT